ncbi:MAG: PadR family transcriptional regulator, partial [Dermatophilaceae bacterium]
YGYGLAQRLAIMGFGEVPGGTLYPALLRLGRDGLVDTSWRPSAAGPRRKYYAVTASGRAEFADRAGRWDAFSASVNTVLETARQPSRRSRGERA